jgi:hypothetical protein
VELDPDAVVAVDGGCGDVAAAAAEGELERAGAPGPVPGEAAELRDERSEPGRRVVVDGAQAREHAGVVRGVGVVIDDRLAV